MDEVSEPQPAHAPAIPLASKIRYSLLTTLAIVVIVELVLQGLGYDKRVVTVPDARVGFRLVPSQDRETPRGQKIHINALGMRDEEFPQKKPEGEFRVLLLGDSLTFGIDVEQNETFASIVRDSLSKRAPPGKTIRVMNGAVQGYDTTNERDWLYTFGFDLEPDLVVVMFYPNDIEIEPRKMAVWEFPGRDALRRTATFNYIETQYIQYESERQGRSGESARKKSEQFKELVKKYTGGKAMNPNDPEDKRRTIVVREMLIDLSKVCARRNVKFAVAMIPGFANTRDPLGPNIMKALAYDFTADPTKIPHLDLIDALKEQHPSCWLPWDEGHLSPLGHRLVATRLESWLVDSKLVPVAK